MNNFKNIIAALLLSTQLISGSFAQTATPAKDEKTIEETVSLVSMIMIIKSIIGLAKKETAPSPNANTSMTLPK
jgi:hypothetical protein